MVSLAQSLAGPSTTAQPSTATVNIEEERRAEDKMSDLLPKDVTEQREVKEEPLPKKPKFFKGLTISEQCHPDEEKQKTKSMFDLASALNELSGDALTEEAKVDEDVSKSQKGKKRTSQQEDVPPSQPRKSDGDEDDLQVSQKNRKEKDFTANDEDE